MKYNITLFNQKGLKLLKLLKIIKNNKFKKMILKYHFLTALIKGIDKWQFKSQFPKNVNQEIKARK
jgi:hypothetical protein